MNQKIIERKLLITGFGAVEVIQSRPVQAGTISEFKFKLRQLNTYYRVSRRDVEHAIGQPIQKKPYSPLVCTVVEHVL